MEILNKINLIFENVNESKAENVAKSLGLVIVPRKQKKGNVGYYSRGNEIEIPHDVDINSKEVQHHLFHEIGHIVDEVETFGGRMKTNVDSTRFKSKFSMYDIDLLKSNANYILKDKEKVILNLDFKYIDKDGIKHKFNTIEDVENSKVLSPLNKHKFIKSFKSAERKYFNYQRQSIELFADGFAQYITNKDLVKKENPELYKFYTNVISQNDKLNNISN